MLLVNPSELLPLQAAVPKSSFPLPEAPQPCTPLLCGIKMGTRATRTERGFASIYLKHQGRVPGTSGHSTSEESTLSTLPAGRAVGWGHGKGWLNSVPGGVLSQMP